ncbi:hypothetical protein L873DRAFT_1313352 [Choiromyces venosus 120613-1]|uniref:Uncharacterized protein n=1 Tax=Choiromyces venosus 120613-1 TaxID=1336337 RepID=A0A3N4JB27_9PEZI|nr:hypothetical protein L873DRAFT_1313352 [Choiromyces venosus 120613-1]
MRFVRSAQSVGRFVSWLLSLGFSCYAGALPLIFGLFCLLELVVIIFAIGVFMHGLRIQGFVRVALKFFFTGIVTTRTYMVGVCYYSIGIGNECSGVDSGSIRLLAVS